jgi:outer membrane protein TolC
MSFLPPRRVLAGLALFLSALAAGCTGPGAPAERTARQQVDRIGRELKPANARAALPALRPDSPPADFVRFAVLKHPAVAAAYHDWHASVEGIAPARSLPDPNFTFQADITDTLTSFMPGLMFDFMAPGKRAAMGREATAASDVAYRAYVGTVLRTAAEVRRTWIEFAYLDEVHQLYATTLETAEQGLALANSDYTTSRGMVSFDKQARWQNEAARHRAHHAALADRQAAARSRFRSALGLGPDDPDPPWPHPALTATPLPPEDELWRRTASTNPGLAQMRAMVDMAVAGVEVARKAGTPDYSLGLMADLKANPLLLRPTATLTLPVWRDKIAATIASAEARRDAAAARVTVEQLSLAAEFAQLLYMVREADRTLAYMDNFAIPNFERTLASIEAGIQSGMGAIDMIPETRMMILDMRHDRAAMLRDRELAATDLMLLAAAVGPVDSPLLVDPTAVHP